MNAKEALEKLCKNNVINVYDNDDKEEVEIIEIALNRLEELEKVLKIIKEKKVDCFILPYQKSVEQYNSYACNYIKLTEAEFNLLKEYLK